MSKQILTGHVSPETAYIVDDYPYGFRLRCKIRYWIESDKKRGQRLCTQTTNPKSPGERWNKPKKSTYSDLMAMYIEPETGHVKHDAFGIIYGEVGKFQSFIEEYGAALTGENEVKTIKDAWFVFLSRKYMDQLCRDAGVEDGNIYYCKDGMKRQEIVAQAKASALKEMNERGLHL